MGLPPFDTVVTEHGPVVLRVLRGTLGAADADDAWQETFVAALRAYPRLRPDSDLRAWLLTIAHRKAIDAARARGRRAVPVPQVPEGCGSPPAALPAAGLPVAGLPADGAEAVVDALTLSGLWRHVAGLPDKQRLAVAYRYGADLGYDQIAQLIGCSEDAARRSAFEGIRRLRGTVPATFTREEEVGR